MEHTGGRHKITEKRPQHGGQEGYDPGAKPYGIHKVTRTLSARPNTMFGSEGGHDPIQPENAAFQHGVNGEPQVYT